MASGPINRHVENTRRPRCRQTASKESGQAFSQDTGPNGRPLQAMPAGVGIEHREDGTRRVEAPVQRDREPATERLEVALVVGPIEFVLNDQKFGLNAESARGVQCVW